MTVRTEAGKMLIGAIVADELLGDPRGYVFEIERQARAAALREVTKRIEKEIRGRENILRHTGSSWEEQRYIAGLERAAAILTEATGASE